MANLQDKFPFGRELQELVVFFRASAEPDIVFGIDEDSVLRREPFVARPRAAPCLKELSVSVEFQNRWRGNAALRLGRVEGGGLFTVRNRRRPMKDPDIVVRIDGNSA